MSYYAELWINGEMESCSVMDLDHVLSWVRLSVCDVIGYKKAKQITRNIKNQFNRELNIARCGWQDSSIMVFFDVIQVRGDV